MQHKDRLSDEERKARRLESARKYREANREKVREACRKAMAKKRQDPEFLERDKAYKKTERYLEQQRQYRAVNREKLDAKTAAWREANRHIFDSYQRAYQVANRRRTIARLKRWRQENPEKSREQGRRWRMDKPELNRIKANRYRARKLQASGDFSPDIYQRLMSLQKGRCAVCTKSLKGTSPHLDHVMPLALGGSNTDDNAQLLCPSCNSRKNAKHPVDFMQERGFLC